MSEQLKHPWPLLAWAGAVLLLAAPFLAMCVGSTGVNWTSARQ